MKFFKLIAIVVSLIIGAIVLYVWIRGNDPQKFVIRELIPEVQPDKISSEYQSSIIELYPTFSQDPFPSLSTEEEKFTDKIIEVDPEIIIPRGQDKRFSVMLLPRDPALSFVPYFGTKNFSCPGDIFGPSCIVKSDLKILDLKDDSIHKVINTEFTEGTTIFELGKIFLLKEQKQLFIFGGKNFPGEYIIYNLVSNTIQFDGRKDSAKTISFGEYLVSYETQNSMLSFRNLIKGSEANCAIRRYKNVKAALDEFFDYQHFTLSPNGKSFLIFSNKNDIYAGQTEMGSEKSSSVCTRIVKGDVEGIQNLHNISYEYQSYGNDIETNWYDEGRFFAPIDYGANILIYDFQGNEPITYFPIENALSAGVRTNNGYLSDANLDYKGYILRTNKAPDGLEVFLVGLDGESQILTFYKYSSVPSETWTMINKGKKEGIFEILVLDGYRLRHLVELSIK